MKFRFEDKIKLDKEKIFDFKSWLLKNNFKSLYTQREIYSIYFDNSKFQTFKESEEGVTPRKKFRVRTYNFESFKKNKFNLEIKKTLNFGRSKSSEKIDNVNHFLKVGLIFKNYGICYPKIIVKYFRNYYRNNLVRVTLDTKIKFKKFNNSKLNNVFFKEIGFVVAEIKYKNENDILELKDNFNFDKTRFSKYCFGVERLKFA
tara:strand:- start:12 stop:620 length:609 start_codon:yes stop_codon:yes gene_type:complete